MVDLGDLGGAPVASGPQPVDFNSAISPQVEAPVEGAGDRGLGAGDESPQPQPTDPQAPAPSPQPPAPWRPGDPPPWGNSPDGPAMPNVSQYPPVNPEMLQPAVIEANERAIVAQFTAQINATADQAERVRIDQQYQMALGNYRLQVQKAVADLRDWQAAQREQQVMMNMLPALREMTADDLAKKTGVPKEMLLVDYFTKQPIWNVAAMTKQAEWLKSMGHQRRVAARGARDAGLSAGTGSPGPTVDIKKMSDSEFAKYRESVRKSGGRLLNVI
jgi:hypothetical protein